LSQIDVDTVGIVPIAQGHIESFHRTLDFVARERQYLSFLEAPPIELTRAFVLNNIKCRYPQYVVVTAGEVVGWCDVIPKERPIYAHGGVLGMGLLPQFRSQGIGTRLIRPVLAAARTAGLHRVELTVRETNASAIALYRKAGFAVEGLHRDAVRIDGLHENVICMALLF